MAALYAQLRAKRGVLSLTHTSHLIRMLSAITAHHAFLLLSREVEKHLKTQKECAGKYTYGKCFCETKCFPVRITNPTHVHQCATYPHWQTMVKRCHQYATQPRNVNVGMILKIQCLDTFNTFGVLNRAVLFVTSKTERSVHFT